MSPFPDFGLSPTAWLAITNLGHDEVFIAVLALYTWLVSPRGARGLGVAFALSYLVNSALKYGFDMPRPFAESAANAGASEAAQATAGGPSFPSGHAQMATTLWAGMAAQLGSLWLWPVAVLLLVAISYSRLALGVHYPLDVGVGMGLGVLFAGLAAWLGPKLSTPTSHHLQRWLPAALLVLVVALLPAGMPRELAAGAGMLAGFWALRLDFARPTQWWAYPLVAALGLALTLALYIGLSVTLPDAWKAWPAVTAARYAMLVLFAGEGVPWLLQRWLPRGGQQKLEALSTGKHTATTPKAD